MGKAIDILPGVRRIDVPWDIARFSVKDGDILLWSPQDWIGRAIAKETAGPFCHASVVGYAWGSPFEGGYHMQGDGAVHLLRGEVQKYSGLIHVFRLKGICEAEAKTFAAWAMNALSGTYAVESIALIALGQSRIGSLLGLIPPLRRWYDNRVKHQSRKKAGAICSQAIVRAARHSIDKALVPGKPESQVSPNDIGRSDRLEYQFSLLWPEVWGESKAERAFTGAVA